ncbi:hypothetical protein N8444_03145 [Pelagibacteraceae bacterium]|nr:hypothetical protein [Pelagibacteraceae bacterium]
MIFKMRNFKTFFLTAAVIAFMNANAFSEDVLTKEINKAKASIANTAVATKYILTSPKKAKKLITDSIAKIDSDCCEENFIYKKDLEEIKSNLESCIDKKCQNFMIPLYTKKKLPQKLVALRQVKLIDDLLNKNERQKYENLLTKLEADLTKNKNNQKNTKNDLLQKKEENEKLKKIVDRMLASYQTQITNLKKENEILENNFNIVYEAHSKYEQKKLSKKIK